MAETPTASSAPTLVRHLTVLDTDDPAGLARFYCELLGWQLEAADDSWVTISGPGPAAVAPLAFQLVIDHRRPTWPDNEVPQQVHLDFEVADLEPAVAHATALGAERATSPEEGESFVVFIDPSGHPFCLCRAG